MKHRRHSATDYESGREGRRSRVGQRERIADEELGVSGEHAIGQEIAEIFLREAVHDELGHEVQIGARIDLVSDAGGDDAEDSCGALATDVAPGEEPICDRDKAFATHAPDDYS